MVVYIVLHATLCDNYDYISQDDTLLDVYKSFDDAIKKLNNYKNKNKIPGREMHDDKFEKLECGCCKEIYKYGYEDDYHGQKLVYLNVIFIKLYTFTKIYIYYSNLNNKYII